MGHPRCCACCARATSFLSLMSSFLPYAVIAFAAGTALGIGYSTAAIGVRRAKGVAGLALFTLAACLLFAFFPVKALLEAAKLDEDKAWLAGIIARIFIPSSLVASVILEWRRARTGAAASRKSAFGAAMAFGVP